MKKVVTFLFILVIYFFLGTVNTNAQSLDCSILLKNGSRGENVKVLQRMLNEKENCNLTVDGIFGSLTKSCVVQYQSHNNLSADGIVGKNTCSALNNSASSSTATKSPVSKNYTTAAPSSVIKNYKKTNTIKAVVIATEGANIRSEASATSKKIGKAKLGKVVQIIGQVANWYKIKDSNNKIGYIRADLLSKNCIIVDISDQKLTVYRDGSKAWSTSVITGNQNSHDTPIGSYILSPSNFGKDVNLVGKDYVSPVDYWMPFITNRGIGFHDASWRKTYQYNTSTYQGNGSHGCVNMQHEAAEKLYTTTTTNTNVVVRK